MNQIKIKIISFLSYMLFSLFVYLILSQYIINENNNSFDKTMINTEKFVSKSVSVLIENEKDNYIKKARQIFSENEIIEAMKNKDREKFYKLVKPYFDNMQAFDKNFWGLHIIFKDNLSFIRVHKPQAKDSLIKKGSKPLIDKVNEFKQIVTGIDDGKFGYFIRVIYPIFTKEKEYLGAAEFSVNIDSLTSYIKTVFGYNAMFLVDNVNNKKFLADLPKTSNNLSIYKSTSKELENIFSTKNIKNISILKLEDNKHSKISSISLGLNSTLIFAFDIHDIIVNKEKFISNVNFFMYIIFIVSALIWLVATKSTLKYIKLQEDTQKNLEEKIEERTKDLEKEAQIAQDATLAKTYFLANMSHEIRTPMNGIIGMCQLVLNSDLSDKQKKYILNISNSASKLLKIINDILDISKVEAGKIELEKNSFDLFKTVEDVIKLVDLKAFEKNLDLIVEYSPKIGKYYIGDSLRLNQILSNLLSNAVKFTSKGEIKVIIKEGKNNKVRFEVIDTGIGLTQEQINKIFSSFTQADSTTTKKYGGTGLGLSISKQLVELMNGKIWVESNHGYGSKFIFEIELEKDNITHTYRLFDGKRVLIVDDSQSWLDTLETLLVSFGLEVKTAIDGFKAISILEEKNDFFDLIIVDWNMPGIDGIETCKIIENNLGIEAEKIILISATSQNSLFDKIKEAHINHFLHKPVNPSDLNDMLSEIFLGEQNIHKIREIKDKNNLLDEIKTLKGNKILLAEDNITNQEIIKGLLENSGIEVDLAENGAIAVEKAINNSYELILMDIQMPVMDGYEATKEIRKTNKEIPIVALTANAMKEDIEKTLNTGMNKHLTKPIEVEKLYKTLLEFISKKNDENITKTQENFEQTNENDEIDIPDFDNLDKNYGLKLVMNSKKTFIKILEGVIKYKNLDIDGLNEEEYKRTMHTIKGITASAGALKVSNLALELENSSSKELLPEFIKELNKLIDEIETKLKNTLPRNPKKDISIKQKNELFDKLKEAIKTKRAKNCRPILEEIEQFNLENSDKKTFDEIKELCNNFKFSEALDILDNK